MGSFVMGSTGAAVEDEPPGLLEIADGSELDIESSGEPGVWQPTSDRADKRATTVRPNLTVRD
jgi:hypothetical protein